MLVGELKKNELRMTNWHHNQVTVSFDTQAVIIMICRRFHRIIYMGNQTFLFPLLVGSFDLTWFRPRLAIFVHSFINFGMCWKCFVCNWNESKYHYRYEIRYQQIARFPEPAIFNSSYF